VANREDNSFATLLRPFPPRKGLKLTMRSAPMAHRVESDALIVPKIPVMSMMVTKAH
jgi:hypothetical protein